MSMLSARNLSVRFGAQESLRDLSFALERPGIVGVIGPNGAGKTTLLRVLAGILKPQHGEVLIEGRATDTWPRQALAKCIAYLPQSRTIAWPLTCFDIVMLGRLPHRAGLAAPSAHDLHAVLSAMADTDVTGFAGRPFATLSGGEQARVLIARALAQEARILIADEPASGLDPAHQLAALEVFAAKAGQGSFVLVTMHDLSLAAQWCDHLMVLKGGILVKTGPPAAVLTKELLDEVYGIEAAVIDHLGHTLVVPMRKQQGPPSHV